MENTMGYGTMEHIESTMELWAIENTMESISHSSFCSDEELKVSSMVLGMKQQNFKATLNKILATERDHI